jgi:hypothetical protein
MTDDQNWGQAPQHPPQGYGRQYPQEAPWRPQQYDPRQHAQRTYEQAPFSTNPAPIGFTDQRRAPQGPQHAPRGRSATHLYAGIALVIGIAIGGAGGYVLHGSSAAAANTGSATAGPAAAAAAAASSAPATPDTSAAAKSAAAQFFALYSASQWPAAWALMTPADQKTAPLPVYERVHKGCVAKAAGLAYKIEQVTMAGKTAVVTYTIPVMTSLFGSATMPMRLTTGGWRVNPDLGAEYSHGSAAADIAAEKAAGDCAS